MFDPLEKSETDVFRIAGIECPKSLSIVGGKLCYIPPKANDQPLEDANSVRDKESVATKADQNVSRKGKRGRPKVSKNKKTLECEAGTK